MLIGGGEISSIGGVVKFFADFSAFLSESGIHVTLLGNTQNLTSPSWFYTYHPDVLRHAVSYRKLKKEPENLLKLIEEAKPDVIVVKFSNKPVETILKILKDNQIDIPIIRAEHGNVDDLVKTIWSKSWSKRLATFSPSTRIHLLGKNFLERSQFPLSLFCRTFTCPSPVYARTVMPKEEKERYRFIFAGRLEEYEKNAPFAVQAFLNIASKLPDWDLHIMGDGQARKYMEKMVNAAPALAGRVFFHGSLVGADLEQGYRSGDIFLMTSYVEGAPVSLGEALAYGVPAIGFRYCTGVNERIIDNENGLLVDDDEMYQDAMVKLARNKNLRQRLAKNAPKISQKYNYNKIFQKWIVNFQIASWFGQNNLTKSIKKTDCIVEPVVFDDLVSTNEIKLDHLSIVVPYHNMDQQFSQTIDTFNEAAKLGAKIYIIDDGSSPPFKQSGFLSKLHPSIEYFTTYNFGAGASRNLGLSFTETEFVLFFDADDSLSLPNVNRAINAMKSSDYDFIVLPFIHAIFKDNKITKEMRPKYKAILQSKSPAEILKCFCPEIDASSCNKIFRSQFLRKNLLSFPDQYRLEDVAFNALCYQAATKIAVTNFEIGTYNKFQDIQNRAGSASWSAEKLKDALYIFGSLDKFYTKPESKLYNGIYFLPISDYWRKYKLEIKSQFPSQFDNLEKLLEKIKQYGDDFNYINSRRSYGRKIDHPTWVKIRFDEAELNQRINRTFISHIKRLVLRYCNFLSSLRKNSKIF